MVHKNSIDFTQSSPLFSPSILHKTPKKEEPVKKRRRVRFTDAYIANLEPRPKRFEVWDGGLPGFGLRVTPNGNKTWAHFYTIFGQRRKSFLGHYPMVSLADARLAYHRQLSLIQRGIDPKSERGGRKEINTIEQLICAYVDYCKAKGERQWKAKRNNLSKYLGPRYGKMKANRMTYQILDDILQNLIVVQGKHQGAKHLASYFRGLFNYAVQRRIITPADNPVRGLKCSVKIRPEKRAMSPGEIYRFLNGITDVPIPRSHQLALQMMLFTLTRGVEVRTVIWKDLNLAERLWLIPKEKAKNGVAHLLPLSRQAMKIIREVQQLPHQSDHVFTRVWAVGKKRHLYENGLGPLQGDALSKAFKVVRSTIELSEDLTPHDLRKTATTLLTSCSFDRAHVKRLLNHKEQGATQFYDLYDYYEDKWTGVRLLEYIINRIMASPALEYVPSIKTLRREVISRGIIQRLQKEAISDAPIVDPEHNSSDQSARLLTPVSYSLSYGPLVSRHAA